MEDGMSGGKLGLFLDPSPEDAEWHRSVVRESGLCWVDKERSSHWIWYGEKQFTYHNRVSVSFFVCPGCDELIVDEAFWCQNSDPRKVMCLKCGVGK